MRVFKHAHHPFYVCRGSDSVCQWALRVSKGTSLYHIPCFIVNFFVVEQFSFVIICYCSDDAAWVSSGNRPCRNVLCDNTSGTDYHVISDMHAGTHYGISSQPHIIPDRNLFSIFKSRITRIRVNRMPCRINRHIPVCLKYIPCQYPHILHNTAQDILLHLY